jgi:predicted enzyme related to lactoylglutathione lyase
MTKIVLWADKFDETAEFYRLLLDAEFKHASDGFVSVVGQHNEVALHAVAAEWASDISVPPALRDESPLKPCFKVDSIARVRAAVSGTNGLILGADREQTHGDTVYCDGNDPEGNVIQVYTTA